MSSSYMQHNWRIHMLYAKGDFDDCLGVIEEAARESGAICEYPMYVKGMIMRQRGLVEESLKLFQAAACVNPRNTQNLKQAGRSLLLLGKTRKAFAVFEEAQQIDPEDWQIWHNKGLCHNQLKEHAKALECFQHALTLQRHQLPFVEMAKVHEAQGDERAALEAYKSALEISPEDPEMLTNVGLLHLRLGDNNRAFEYLGNSLSHDGENPRTILAAGAILQEQEDVEVALSKYRIAAQKTPNSAELWNNIGMCLFSKQKIVAAISCLKRASYLNPFEWIICHNLGIVYLHNGQYASAFHYLSSCINLKPRYATSYMYLGIALSRMDDFENACSAYARALQIEDSYLIHLNYAVMLLNNDEVEEAEEHYRRYRECVQKLGNEVEIEASVSQTAKALSAALGA